MKDGIYKIRLSKQATLGYTLILFVSIQYGIQYTDIEIPSFGLIDKLLFVICTVIFGVYVVSGKYKAKTLKLIVVSLAAACIVGSYGFMQIMMIAIVCSSLKYEDVFAFLLLVRGTMLLFVVFLSLIGVFNIHNMDVYKAGLMKNAYGLGYSHPNRLAVVIEFIIVLIVGWRNKRNNIKSYTCIIFIAGIGFLLTKSRTLLLLTAGLLSLCIYYNRGRIHKFSKKMLYIVGISIMPFCVFISYFVSVSLNLTNKFGKIVNMLNLLFSNRFTHINRALRFYPITMFGGTNSFELLEQNFNFATIDNGYICLIYRFGIVGAVVFCVFSILCVKKLFKQRQYIYVIIYIITSVWGISENVLNSFAFNMIIMFWSILLVNRNDGIPKKDEVENDTQKNTLYLARKESTE